MSRHYSQHSWHAWPTRGYAAQHNALGLVFSPADHISHSPRSAAFHSVGEQQLTQRLDVILSDTVLHFLIAIC
ncbi:hypothetical protein GGF50DRAFT_115808 [Schizophyllum commune]